MADQIFITRTCGDQQNLVARHSSRIPVQPLAQNCSVSVVGLFRDCVGPHIRKAQYCVCIDTALAWPVLGRPRPGAAEALATGGEPCVGGAQGVSIEGASKRIISVVRKRLSGGWLLVGGGLRATQQRSNPPAAPHTRGPSFPWIARRVFCGTPAQRHTAALYIGPVCGADCCSPTRAVPERLIPSQRPIPSQRSIHSQRPIPCQRPPSLSPPPSFARFWLGATTTTCDAHITSRCYHVCLHRNHHHGHAHSNEATRRH